MVIKILNLYSGIGGNRKLWGGDIMVTAIENNTQIAKIYQDFFPNDKVIVTDAHQYLLEHYKEFDFIWSSPPCPSHSRTNTFLNPMGYIRYPDMSLYQEIIFLNHFFKGKFVVENVISYYKPLIRPQQLARHYFWANFHIENKESDYKASFNITNSRESTRRSTRDYINKLEEFHGIYLDKVKIKNKKLTLRNCVDPKLGLHIFKMAFKEKQEVLI
jgi:DNA (cytosine-5)-methyltransferase 1